MSITERGLRPGQKPDRCTAISGKLLKSMSDKDSYDKLGENAETGPEKQRPEKQNWRLSLAYDGTGFSGWQVQPGLSTVQGELQAALQRITGESPLPQGSGRTDAGVHALAQVASFALAAPIPASNLMRALNRTLPSSIRILAATPAPFSFHARHSARAKTYLYRIFQGALCPPFLAPYVYPYAFPLALERLNRTAAAFVGEHDFLSFAASDPDLSARKKAATSDCSDDLDEVDLHDRATGAVDPGRSTVRTVFASAWHREELGSARELGTVQEQRLDPLNCTLSAEDHLLVYRVRGSGFLHHMVRNLVGTMLEAARGQFKPDGMEAILAAGQRKAAGPTAPARGLFLHSVEYEDDKDGTTARADS